MSEKDNVRVCDEIGNMLLLDFLRKYRGSPAISTLTMKELVGLYQSVSSDELDFGDLLNMVSAEPPGHPCVCRQAVDEPVAVEHEVPPDLSGDIDLDPGEEMVTLDELFNENHDPPSDYQKEVESAAREAEADLQHPDGTDAVKPASPEYACFQGDPASLVKRAEPAAEQPVVPPAAPAVQDKILWKLMSDPQNYNFVSFDSLRKWVGNLPNSDLARISIDNGKTWKAFGEVMAYLFASSFRLTPLESFDRADVIGFGSSSDLEPETPGVVETTPEAESASDMAPIVSTIPEVELASSDASEDKPTDSPESDESFTPNGSYAATPAVDSSSDSSEQSVELDSQEVFDEEPGDWEPLDEEPVNPDQTDSSVEKPTQPEASIAPAVTVVNEIIWRLRGESERVYEFHGFAALQQGVNNLPDAPDKIYISLDGKEWKAYEQVNGLIINGVRLRDAYEVATPIRFSKPNLNEIPEVDLTKCDIRRDTVELLSREDCESKMIIPVAIHGNVLVVAVANPDDLGLVAYLENKYPYSISRVAAEEKQILNILETIYEEKSK